MDIEIKHIQKNDIINGTAVFRTPNGLECKLQLQSVDYIELDLRNNLLYCPEIKDEYGLWDDGILTGKVCINIDGWFHMHHELIIRYVSTDVIRISVKWRDGVL